MTNKYIPFSLFSYLLLLLSPVAAQHIDVQYGAALPNGSFGNNDVAKAENAFAQTGSTIGLQVDYPIFKKIGMVAKLNRSTFGFNTSSYQQQVNQNPASNTTVTVESNGGYTATTAMAGGLMTIGSKQVTLDFRLLTGFISLTDNGLTYKTLYAGQEYTKRVFSQQDAAVAFSWGATLRYMFFRDLYSSLNLDNVYASTTFPATEYQSSTNQTVTKPFQTYLITFGIGYKFAH